MEEPILEVGVGTGRILRTLAEHRSLLVGIDADPEMIRHFDEKLRNNDKLRLSIDLVVADGETLPFRDGVFGGVICVRVLKYFHRPLAGLAEMRRILRTRGKMMVEFANMFGMGALIQLPGYVLKGEFYPRLFTRKGVDAWMTGLDMSVGEVVAWHKLPPRIVTASNNHVVLRIFSLFEDFLQRTTPTEFMARSIVMSALKNPKMLEKNTSLHDLPMGKHDSPVRSIVQDRGTP